MKKYSVLFLAIFALACNKAGLETTDDVCTKMDDINFMKFCYANFDANGDGKVSMEEANAVKKFVCNNQQVASVKGIEYFSNIESLNLEYNQITALDLKSFHNLNYLSVRENGLKEIDLSKAPKLTFANVSFNYNLTSLDVSKNTELKMLVCERCSLTSLVLTPTLQSLYCGQNKLERLDLSNSASLSVISCKYNSLQSVDISATAWTSSAAEGRTDYYHTSWSSPCDSRDFFIHIRGITVYLNQAQYETLYFKKDYKSNYEPTVFEVK